MDRVDTEKEDKWDCFVCLFYFIFFVERNKNRGEKEIWLDMRKIEREIVGVFERTINSEMRERGIWMY